MGSQSATNRRILVVDDDRALRLALSTLLKDAGHDVETAGDGPEALALLQDRAFDIVLLDIGLPSMSGLDVLARARALEKPPLVIMMTADDTPETVLESVRRQAFRYLRKPFPPNAIVDVVNDALAFRGRAFVRSGVGAAGMAGAGRAMHARNGRSHPVVRHAARCASPRGRP